MYAELRTGASDCEMDDSGDGTLGGSGTRRYEHSNKLWLTPTHAAIIALETTQLVSGALRKFDSESGALITNEA